ncbi:MAG: hypothetical protein J6E38_05560 [Clostridia bacterium]|nr:hypothetical protein [Clostridia bacterium]
MKKGISVEFKIIFSAVVVLLALLTAVVAMQIFRKNNESVTFVYNSAQAEIAMGVNILDIFSEM